MASVRIEERSDTDVNVKIVRKSDDPDGVVRVSVGGLGGTLPEGVYVVYRGSKERAIEVLSHALESMKSMAKVAGPDNDLEISPDDGKRYA